MRRGQADHAAIDDEDHAPKGATDANAAPGDRLEDRVDVGRGATDHAEDLAGRSSGFNAPLTCACASVSAVLLHLLEQPRVLDGDQGLVGESLDQLDLPVGERLEGIAGHRDDADRHIIAEERYGKDRASSAGSVDIAGGELRVDRAVRHVDRATLARGLARRRA